MVGCERGLERQPGRGLSDVYYVCSNDAGMT